ncbi:MAG: Gfo/Idh/MocA family oxidoreductase [Thermobifida fusca]|uniref:Gfo/Idh/MocA family protein n=1 Tax=Thermobifida TaxID=83677 RepID=UPI000CEE2356|nr:MULTISPECIES: Gfo/Idh/MocA family oxidoreductase [Thermobifida]MBO2529136.1 oxidoreductase [Thermobifida sp.]PPS94650.1 oxidoreductase [Thermobifida fusca]
MTPTLPIPVVLAGVHGHGRSHLRTLQRLSEQGIVRLVGVCDPRPVPPSLLDGFGSVTYSPDLSDVLRTTGAAITILVTPIHTHLPLARTALEHGSHLLVEKPPTATLAEFEELCTAVALSGLACQVGFQSLGSSAVAAVRSLIADGAIGAVRGIGGAGTWIRTSAYYERAAWAGRRRLDGRDVVDGALTNPFAHAIITALAVADAEGAVSGPIELELFHAHAIESDDTSCVRFRSSTGVPISIAVTLCAAEHRPPQLVVHGDTGRIIFEYTLDRVTLDRDGADPVTTVYPRTGLMENLVAHITREVPLLVPPEATRGFMTVLEAVRCAPDPRPIPESAQQVSVTAEGTRRIVSGIDELVHRSASHIALFSELDAPWASMTEVAP